MAHNPVSSQTPRNDRLRTACNCGPKSPSHWCRLVSRRHTTRGPRNMSCRLQPETGRRHTQRNSLRPRRRNTGRRHSRRTCCPPCRSPRRAPTDLLHIEYAPDRTFARLHPGTARAHTRCNWQRPSRSKPGQPCMQCSDLGRSAYCPNRTSPANTAAPHHSTGTRGQAGTCRSGTRRRQRRSLCWRTYPESNPHTAWSLNSTTRTRICLECRVAWCRNKAGWV